MFQWIWDANVKWTPASYFNFNLISHYLFQNFFGSKSMHHLPAESSSKSKFAFLYFEKFSNWFIFFLIKNISLFLVAWKIRKLLTHESGFLMLRFFRWWIFRWKPIQIFQQAEIEIFALIKSCLKIIHQIFVDVRINWTFFARISPSVLPCIWRKHNW